MLDEMDMVRDLEPPRYISASGYQMATGYYYHMGHSWSRFEHGGRIRVGVDDFRVKVFGSASSLNLPPLGEKMQQNKVGCAFARSGRTGAEAISDVFGSFPEIGWDALVKTFLRTEIRFSISGKL